MAYSKEQNPKEDKQYNMDLLDGQLPQGLQDNFCATANVYCVCLSQTQGVITKAYGTKEELNYIHGKIGMGQHIVLLNKLLQTEMEDVIEETLKEDYLKMSGITIRISGKISAIWIVIGVIKEENIEGTDVPEYVKTTTTEQYYNAIRLLTYLSKQYFASKMDEITAQEAFAKSRDSQKQIQEELKRNEVMTSIVQMLESENAFSKIVDDILNDVCAYLKISNAALLRVGRDGKTVDMLSECSCGEKSYAAECQGIEAERFPFLTGNPYMISSSVVIPERFRDFFQEYGIKAGISFPVEISGKAAMYLCFFETERDRIWSVGDIQFLHEVKQIVQSILTKRITKNSLASSYASLEAILENVGCGICVKDTVKNKVLYTNRQYLTMFEGIDIDKEYDRTKERCHELGKGKFMEYYFEEENRYFDVYYTQINWVDGRRVMLSTAYDVTDKKIYQQRIEKQANNDFLTGLYNRMRGEHDIEFAVQQAKESGRQGALLYMDLDDFKHINDGLGHQYGDILLKAIAHGLQKISGVESNCYRMGGDEFIIIISHHQYNRLNELLEEIQAVFDKPWFLKGADYYCTMSMGIVRFPSDGDTVQELIKKADIALYEAKKSGKNRIEFYDSNVEITAFNRLDLEKNMRYATSNSCSEFEVYYQPIVDITKEGDPCIGAEALIRWNSETMGQLSPTEFIPLAEYLGLINPIGAHVLKKACHRCKYWNDMGHPDYHVNVNLSVVQLLQNDMVDSVRRILEETGLKPENLTLEVTEGLAINDIGRMKKILGEIKQLGVRVALDDFGTGYSSLNHIRELPIDVIKIDRCFVMDMGKDNYSEMFVKMVSELAETIGMHMCVEGVEAPEQLRKLRNMKIQYIQGFYYGKPMKASEFEARYL